MQAAGRRFDVKVDADELVGQYHLACADLLAQETAAGTPGPGAGSGLRLYTAALLAVLSVHGARLGARDEAWLQEEYHEAHRRHVRLHDDARPALAALAGAGVHVGLVTDVDAPFLDYHLRFLDLEGAFDSVTTASDAGALKPDPRIFRLALSRARVPAGRAVMVGDSLERDVDGALAAGLRAVLVDRYGARRTDVPRVRSLRELPRALARLDGLQSER